MGISGLGALNPPYPSVIFVNLVRNAELPSPLPFSLVRVRRRAGDSGGWVKNVFQGPRINVRATYETRVATGRIPRRSLWTRAASPRAGLRYATKWVGPKVAPLNKSRWAREAGRSRDLWNARSYNEAIHANTRCI